MVFTVSPTLYVRKNMVSVVFLFHESFCFMRSDFNAFHNSLEGTEFRCFKRRLNYSPFLHSQLDI